MKYINLQNSENAAKMSVPNSFMFNQIYCSKVKFCRYNNPNFIFDKSIIMSKLISEIINITFFARFVILSISKIYFTFFHKFTYVSQIVLPGNKEPA